MLSENNICRINTQITNELRTVDSWTVSTEDKTAALERVAKLKALLDEPADSEKKSDHTETYDLADLGRDIRDLIRTIRRS